MVTMRRNIMAEATILWFRQDLRIDDQAALAAAAANGPVICLYVLDDQSPGDWAIGGAQRWWLHHSLTALAHDLKARGATLILRRGAAVEQVAQLSEELGGAPVHALRHYEPWWKQAEAELSKRVRLTLYDGTRLIPPDQLRTGNGGRYRIFTPFWRALAGCMPPPRPVDAPRRIVSPPHIPSGESLTSWALLPEKPNWATGFDIWHPGENGARAMLDRVTADTVGAYATARNLPSVSGSTRLSPHLHFGEVSPARMWWHASALGEDAMPLLRELAWRDFTANLIDQIPSYGAKPGREAFDRFPWREGAESDRDFTAWTRGRTGYPIVDAGMRELWATGFMHNRVRMIAASFLVKHLLIDWRRGERWFWDTLVDADYGNNSVNWQWVAGTGVDSSPFGRIMAPLVQSRKFEAAEYIRRWVPELSHLSDDTIHEPDATDLRPATYPAPIIGHREARERALSAARMRSLDDYS
jgi:deoxyribodipyrimidine photo-lyase